MRRFFIAYKTSLVNIQVMNECKQVKIDNLDNIISTKLLLKNKLVTFVVHDRCKALLDNVLET